MIQYAYSADDIGRLFLLPAYAGVFLLKGLKMNKLSNNILTLMRSDAYLNSNNPNHAAVAKQVQDYFENKYRDGWTNRTNRY